MDDFDKYLNEQLKNPEFAQLWEEDEIEYVLAKNIIRCRTKLGLSQCELAKRAKMTQTAISRVESAESNVTLRTMKRLAQALHTTVPQLIDNGQREKVTA